MLSTWLFTGACVLCLSVAVWAFRIATYAVGVCNECMAELEKRGEPQQLASLSNRLLTLETEITDTRDAISSVSSSLKKLRSRITMRNRRENGVDEEPAPDIKTQLRRKHLNLPRK